MLDKVVKTHFTEGWVERLGPFLFSHEFETILKTIIYQKKQGRVYPEVKDIFRIFKMIEPEDVKVVMMAMDPYKRRKEATGIAMGIGDLPYIPPTLNSLFDEIERDLRYRPTDLSLVSWIEQGVMLNNCALTVREGVSDSHSDLWRPFTKNFLKRMSELDSGKIYVLLGAKARKYSPFIDPLLNDIFTVSHPVADLYGSKKTFYGCGIFSTINKLLDERNGWKIHW